MTRKTTKNNDSLLGMMFLSALILLLNWAVRNQQIALTLAEQPQLILPYLTKLILNCADPQTAETMAKIIGKQESLQVTSNRSRTNHRGGQNKTVSENEQIKESFAVLPAQLQDLPDLRGYFKIAGLPAASVKVKLKKFSKQIKRFVLGTGVGIGQEQESIQQQWTKLQL